MKSHLSPRRLAEAIGVSESSVKRWVDSGLISTSLTAGGHRRIPRDEAVRFIRQSRSRLVRPEVLGIEVAPEAGGPPEERLFDLLCEGKREEAVAFLQWLYLAGSSLASIVDGPIRAAMDRVGRLWRDRTERGIYLEHRATQISIRAVHELAALIPRPAPGARLALGGAPAGDPYILPSLSAASVLAESGFSTDNLGPDTPIDSFVAAIKDRRPALVWLSITSPLSSKELGGWVDRLHAAISKAGALLVLGGRESGAIRADEQRSVFHGQSMTELAAYAHGFADRR